MPDRRYIVNEIFYSLQGEGHRAGSANVFLRLAGCNLQCSRDGEAGFDCDTEFTSGREMDAAAIALACRELGAGCGWVIVTGGEPSLQLDAALVGALRSAEFKVAIETNGTRELAVDVDWVSCSPKTAEHTLKIQHVDELRYVRRAEMAVPKPRLQASHLFISPAAQPDGRFDPRDLAWCIDLVKQNPGWRLSVQQHKTWGVR